jgi:hypothetical protein
LNAIARVYNVSAGALSPRLISTVSISRDVDPRDTETQKVHSPFVFAIIDFDLLVAASDASRCLTLILR